MKFLIAPDSFKNCLPSIEVGNYIAAGIKKAIPQAETIVVPMADGGEGTVDAILYGIGGTKKEVIVKDPLLRPIKAYYGISKDKSTAIIEMAQAGGLELLKKEERNAMLTSTYGTGQLIMDAIESGCTNIVLGIGGSATNDGGVGMAKALGYKFHNKNGASISHGGAALGEIHEIISDKVDPRISQVNIEVACDVKNAFYGSEGASVIYGPQKGAKPEEVKLLDANLKHLSFKIKEAFGIAIGEMEGAGAAGGLGGGLAAFAYAKLVPGFPLIANLSKLEDKIAVTDIVVTAEGSVDHQTLFGKTPAGLGALAKKYNKPVFVFGGGINDNVGNYKEKGITGLIPITRRPINLSEAIANAKEWLISAGEEFATILNTGFKQK